VLLHFVFFSNRERERDPGGRVAAGELLSSKKKKIFNFYIYIYIQQTGKLFK
jgi:hypothetical protein